MSTTTQSLTLYEITEEIAALDSLVDPETGEWSDTHEELHREVIGKLVAKADSFGAYLREQEARAAMIGAEIERLTARKRAHANRVASLKRYGLMALQAMGRTKIEGTFFSLTAQANPPSVEVTVTVDELPAAFVRVIPETRTPDKAALSTALKAGAVVPGCALVTTHSLRVR